MAPANNNKNIENLRHTTTITYSFTIHSYIYSCTLTITLEMPQKVVACCVFENEYRGEREILCKFVMSSSSSLFVSEYFFFFE